MKRMAVMAIMYIILAGLSYICLYYGLEMLPTSRVLAVLMMSAGGAILVQATLMYYRAALHVEPAT